MPGSSVEENRSVDPAFIFSPDAYPCVISCSRIAEDHFAGNALASEHSGHKCSIVEADSLSFIKNVIKNRKISACYGCCFVFVISDICYNIGINCLNFIKGIFKAFAKFLCLFNGSAGSAVINILVRAKEGCKFVFKGNVGFNRKGKGIFVSAYVFVNFYLIGSVSVGKRKNRPGSFIDIVSISGAGAFYLGFKSFLGIGGGPINVALIIYLFSFDTKTATVCSIVTILFAQISKLATTALTTGFAMYDLSVAPLMAIGAVLGGFIGASISKKCSEKTVEKAFNGVQLFVLAITIFNIIRNTILLNRL